MNYTDIVNVAALCFGIGAILLVMGMALTIFEPFKCLLDLVFKVGICWVAFVGGPVFIAMCPLFYK